MPLQRFTAAHTHRRTILAAVLLSGLTGMLTPGPAWQSALAAGRSPAEQCRIPESAAARSERGREFAQRSYSAAALACAARIYAAAATAIWRCMWKP